MSVALNSTVRESPKEAQGATERLSEFIATTSRHDLPDDVIELAKRYLLDTIGAMVIGSTKPWSRMVSDYCVGVGGCAGGTSTIVGSLSRTAPQMAALANGNMGHGFEIDDVHDESLTHPGVAVIPAVLAVAEREASTGEEVLAAIVGGYELTGRTGLAVGPAHMLDGFYPTGTNGVFGAAAAAAVLLKLNSEQLSHAIGVAGSFASGIVEYAVSGGMVKRLHAGRAAEGGVTAAYLARFGFTGPTTALEGKFGYCQSFSSRPALDRLVEDLGSKFVIREITVKPYFCCADIHPVIDALLEIKSRENVNAQDIERIVVESTTKLFELNYIDGHTSMMAAQYSVPFAVGLVLTRDIRDPGIYQEDILVDPVLRQIQDKVELATSKEFDAVYPRMNSARVAVHLKDGRTVTATCFGSTGSIHKPMSKSQIEEKFLRLADPILPRGIGAKVVELVRALDELRDIRELTALLRFEGAK